GNPHRLLTTMRPDDNWEAEQSKLDAAFQSQFLSKVTPEEKEQWITKSKALHEQQLKTEDISCLPCLQLYDIPMECRREPFTMTEG
ncbi:Eupitrilysin (M16 family), partial [Fasciolopsis buskii]